MSLHSSKEIPEFVKVLIVENSRDDTGLIKSVLNDIPFPNFESEVATSLKEALQKLKAWQGDVILTDLTLPDSNGLETFKSIKKNVSGIPIVVLGNLEDEVTSLEAVRNGAQDYLVKSKLNTSMLSRVLLYAIERRKVQEEIFAAEKKYRTIFENSAVAIMMTDAMETIISCNRQTEKLLRMSKDELIGKKITMIYPEQERKKVDELLTLPKEFQHEIETKVLAKGGIVTDVELTMSILQDAAQKITGAIVIFKDISERKKLETMKNEFISTVSHELRTPMTIIREGVSQVSDGLLGAVSDDQKEILGISLDSIDRLSRIINDLLDISKLDAGKVYLEKKLVNLTEVAEEIEKAFLPKIKSKGLDLVVHCSKEDINVNADRDKIIQVLVNLLGNALKFTEKGKIELSILANGQTVQCSVTDTGKGISKSDLPNVFNKFEQFSRTHGPGEKGTGLGLSIAKSIVEMHHGKIWVESALNRGTTFSFTLPI